MIRKIATLGRPLSKEYVTEYIVQYSDDGEYWRSYVNPNSEAQVIWHKIIKYYYLSNTKCRT